MIRISVLALLATFATTAFAAEEPEWLKTMRARESTSTQLFDVKSTDGFFNAKVPAKPAGPASLEEGSYSVALELAPDIIANCEVIPDGFDLAALLNNTTTATFDILEKEQGKIAMRGVERMDAGHFDGSPFISIDWIYRVDTPKGPMVGSLKQIAAERHGHGVYCVQNDVGYAKSFAALTRAFVQSLQVKEAPTPAEYEEVSVVSLGGMKVGVALSTVRRDADGEFRVDMSTALLVPVTSDSLRAQDSHAVQFVAADGSMINALHVVGMNGEIESNVKLDPVEDGSWRITGEHKGKAIDGTLDGKLSPATYKQQVELRKSLLAAADPAGAKGSEWQWTPLDPLHLVESRIEVTGPAGDGLFNAKETMSGMSLDSVIERGTGLTRRVNMTFGPNVMSIERVYSRGQL